MEENTHLIFSFQVKWENTKTFDLAGKQTLLFPDIGGEFLQKLS